MEVKKLIFDKLEALLSKPATINKFFVFTLEDLKHDSEGCIEVIENYLEQHKDKIEDIEFDTWIDEATFSPVVMMRMIPNKELGRYLHITNVLNSLLPSSIEAHLLRERVTGVFEKFQFEFNEPSIRNNMKQEIEYILGVTILDKTTELNVDQGVANFIVIEDSNEMSLGEYLDAVAAKKRHENG
jgi:hypothetical protein